MHTPAAPSCTPAAVPTTPAMPAPAAGPAARCALVQVRIAQTGDSYACATNESLLAGMLRLGRKGIPVGCVNGGCGVCKVRIVSGAVQPLGPVSRAHVSADEEAHGYTLACRVAPGEAVQLEVAARLRKPFGNCAPTHLPRPTLPGAATRSQRQTPAPPANLQNNQPTRQPINQPKET